MSKWKIAGIAFALFAVAVSLLNASWIAPKPKGKLMLVAHRGIAQPYDRAGLTNETCTAARMLPSGHQFIENSLFSIQHAARLGADAIEIDVHPTADGRIVVFHDWTLDCRTNGTGPVREKTLAELKALDIGYGYTADGGKTFPLRGRGVGAMPTLEEVLRAVPHKMLIVNFKSRDPADADAFLAAVARAGQTVDARFGFSGDAAVTKRLKQQVPDAWVFGKDEIKACLIDYLKLGWSGYVPESCRDTTVAVPLNYQWAIWGWPNRFLDRMASVNTKVILLGDMDENQIAAGLLAPEQLAKVPRSFRGYLWVDNMYDIGRALR